MPDRGTIYALRMSGALDEATLREAFPSHPLIVTECRDIEGTTCLCDGEAEAGILERSAAIPWRALHWIDCGDFHYLTSLLCRKADEPFCLLLLDHHTDMQQPRYGELLSCGGWLRYMMKENRMMKTAVVAGAEEGLRCEVLPFGERAAMISEEECLALDAESLAERISGLMPAEYPVYVSIDKDVLSPEWAETNWDQGSISLTLLESALAALARKRRIIGADICGCLHEPSPKALLADIRIIGTMLDIL